MKLSLTLYNSERLIAWSSGCWWILARSLDDGQSWPPRLRRYDGWRMAILVQQLRRWRYEKPVHAKRIFLPSWSEA
jgi:hypothetical protein